MPMETRWQDQLDSECSSPSTRSLGTDTTMALGSHWTGTIEERGRGQGPRHNTDHEGSAKHKITSHPCEKRDLALVYSPATLSYI